MRRVESPVAGGCADPRPSGAPCDQEPRSLQAQECRNNRTDLRVDGRLAEPRSTPTRPFRAVRDEGIDEIQHSRACRQCATSTCTRPCTKFPVLARSLRAGPRPQDADESAPALIVQDDIDPDLLAAHTDCGSTQPASRGLCLAAPAPSPRSDADQSSGGAGGVTTTACNQTHCSEPTARAARISPRSSQKELL
jgi:hypothetical protein